MSEFVLIHEVLPDGVQTVRRWYAPKGELEFRYGVLEFTDRNRKPYAICPPNGFIFIEASQ